MGRGDREYREVRVKGAGGLACIPKACRPVKIFCFFKFLLLHFQHQQSSI